MSRLNIIRQTRFFLQINTAACSFMPASPNLLVQLSYYLPVDAKKCYKIQKKPTNSIKLNLLSCHLIPVIIKKIYTRSIFFCEFWAIHEFICYKLFGGSLKIFTRYCVTKFAKKILLISLKYSLESFTLTPYIFIKRYTWSINFEAINWKLSIFWTFSKINLAS